jgi:hypothetical protein
MKHNKMKRVLAATLSLLTVASPMGANVGGFIAQGPAVLVANAYENERCAIDFTDVEGLTKINGVNAAIFHGTMDPEVGSDVTIEATYKLTFPEGFDVTETGSNGAYTYTFAVPDVAEADIDNALSEVTVIPYDEVVDSYLHVYEGSLEKNEDGTYKEIDPEVNPEIMDGDDEVKQGTKVTIIANTPFEIKVDVDGVDTVVATGRWNATAGVYALENYYIENAAVTFEGTAHVPVYAYTGNRTNVIKATDTTDNASVIDEVAASVWGYYANDGEDAEENPELQLANHGRYIYDQDTPVVVRMTRDDELLGTGANRENLDRDQQYAFKYKITKDGEVYNDLEGTVVMGDLETADNPFYNAEDDFFTLFQAVDQGHYEVTITVWGTDNEAAAMYVNYVFDIVPATLDVHSFDLYITPWDAVAEGDNDDEFEAFRRVDEPDFFDAATGVWKIHVPEELIAKDDNGVKYFTGWEDELNDYYDTIGVTARLNEKFAEKFEDLQYGPDGYQVIESQVGKDLDTVYHITVEIYDPNYGGSAEDPVVIDIPWMLVEEEEDPYLYLDGHTELDVERPDDDILTIRGRDAVDADSIKKAIMGYWYEEDEETGESWEVYNILKFSSDFDINKVSFKYMPESFWDSAEGLNQLDALIDGVPTEDGRYKVYLCYDGELVEDYADDGDQNETPDNPDETGYEFMYVKIIKSNYTLEFGEDALEITYGDEVVLSDYAILDFIGEEATDVTFEADDFTYDGNVNAGLLDVGQHWIDVVAENEDGVRAAGVLEVQVNPKEITRNMVGFINRDYADGATVYVWNPYTAEGKIVAKDTFNYIDVDGQKKAKTNYVEMAAVGGTYSQTRIGTYNVQLSIRTQQDVVAVNAVTLENFYNSFMSDDQDLYEAVMEEFIDSGEDPLGYFAEFYFTRVLLRRNMSYEQYSGLSIIDAWLLSGCDYDADEMADALGVETDATMEELFNKFLEEWPDLSTLAVPVESAADNYTLTNRKLKTTWNIVGDDGRPTFVDFETASGPQKARLFDGGKLHVAISRGEVPENAEDKTTVKSFGVIIDKEAKLAAPADDNDVVAYSAAATALVLDNGYTTSGRNLSATEGAKYTRGANIQIVDASIGVWVRPYYEDKDGQAHYGDPMYFSLPEVTQAELQLRVSGWAGVDAVTREEVNPATNPATYTDKVVNQDGDLDYDYIDKLGKTYDVGPVEEVLTRKNDQNQDEEYLNRRIYYFAAVKNTLDAITAEQEPEKTNQRAKVNPERFGVVLDKKGIVPGAEGADIDKAYEAAREQLKADDTRFTTTTAKASDRHGENAYGANITPTDVFTGVWVRPYVDFGNNLIVYGEPVYFDSFNEYYTAQYGIDFESDEVDAENYKAITTNKNGNETVEKFRFFAKPAVDADYGDGKWYNGDLDRELSYEKVGVVVDKTNSVKNLDKLSLANVDSKNVVSGFWKKDKVDDDQNNGVYGADLIKTTGTINVRPYIVIDDKLTVYGPVQSVTWDDAVEGVDSWYPHD